MERFPQRVPKADLGLGFVGINLPAYHLKWFNPRYSHHCCCSRITPMYFPGFVVFNSFMNCHQGVVQMVVGWLKTQTRTHTHGQVLPIDLLITNINWLMFNRTTTKYARLSNVQCWSGVRLHVTFCITGWSWSYTIGRAIIAYQSSSSFILKTSISSTLC